MLDTFVHRMIDERHHRGNGTNDLLPNAAQGAGGPRLGVGRSLALVESQLILATVAQKYRLELAPGCPVEPKAMMTLEPRHGLMMTLQQPPA